MTLEHHDPETMWLEAEDELRSVRRGRDRLRAWLDVIAERPFRDGTTPKQKARAALDGESSDIAAPPLGRAAPDKEDR